MQNWRLLLSALVLLACCCSVAQDAARQDASRQGSAAAVQFSKRAVRLIGRISDDGQFLIADPDQDVWTVINSDAIKPYARQRIVVLAQTSADKTELRVLSTTPEKDRWQKVAKWSDPAFRR